MLKNKKLETVDKEFLEEFKNKFMEDKLNELIKEENLEIKIKSDNLKSYIDLKQNYHKNTIKKVFNNNLEKSTSKKQISKRQ